MPDLRDELAEALYNIGRQTYEPSFADAIARTPGIHDPIRFGGWASHCRGLADALLPIITRETDKARGDRATPEYIAEQRTLGWPAIHPEDYCHLCGERNPLWVTDRETWLTATAAWAAETGREGICCPKCFADMHLEQTGMTTIWWLSAHGGES